TGNGRSRVAATLDAIQDLVPPLALSAMCDDTHPPSVIPQSTRFRPHAPVERHRQVLDEDRRARRARTACHGAPFVRSRAGRPARESCGLVEYSTRNYTTCERKHKAEPEDGDQPPRRRNAGRYDR